MKALIFALALIACVSSTNHIAPHVKNLLQFGYKVDEVTNLLLEIYKSKASHLQAVYENWAVKQPVLQQIVDAAQNAFDTQTQTCAEIDANVAAEQDELVRYKQNVRNARDHIQNNEDTLADRLEKRCAANLLFVNKLKDNQDAERLLQFLLDRIQSPGFKNYLGNNEGSFLELKEANKKNVGMLAHIAKHHMMAMLQQAYSVDDANTDLGYDTEARTEEEVGNEHVDNDRDAVDLGSYNVDVRDIDNFVAELAQTVQGLIDQLDQERVDLFVTEFQAVEDLINYQDTVEQENLVLNSYIELWNGHIDYLEELIAANQEASEVCHEEADELEVELEGAEQNYEDAEDSFNARVSADQFTLAAFEEIIRVYVERVASPSESYKARIDDEIEAHRPHPVEPAPQPTPLEVEDAAEEFEAEQRQEEQAALQAQNEAREEERQEAIEEAEVDAQNEQEQAREEEEREEAARNLEEDQEARAEALGEEAAEQENEIVEEEEAEEEEEVVDWEDVVEPEEEVEEEEFENPWEEDGEEDDREFIFAQRRRF